ncbi:MAG: PQQ-binding-like beta-propeller repeat protein [Phycisphaerae bacterium]|nr:PQQ-binding-like beta-propeller repeat protein [Phycisphaerae bacterium]
MTRLGITAFCLLLLSRGVSAADWPMYRADAARSGQTAEHLPGKLSLEWTYKPRHAPMPAWPRPEERPIDRRHKDPLPPDRLPFDRAFHTVIAGGLLFFGSSADCTVHALDASTGQERWHYITDAPIRFAPVAWKDRLFVASDDGNLYCLSAKDGTLLWKRRGGPDDRMILGNGRMISHWPARGGPVVADDIVYFAAGIWPSDGVYLYALEAATGKVIWCNDQAGFVKMDQPHPTAEARSGVSAQGYLVVAGDKLIVPTGRAVPAVFHRKTGALIVLTDPKTGEPLRNKDTGKPLFYFHLQLYMQQGGTPTLAIDDHFFNDDRAYALSNGLAITRGFRTTCTAAGTDVIVHGDDKRIAAVDRAKPFVEKKVPSGTKTKKITVPNTTWTLDIPEGAGTAVVVAGKTAVCASPKKVTTVDLETRKIMWSDGVIGVPYGLAVADGRLYVSTDQGAIHCFDSRPVQGAARELPEKDESVSSKSGGELLGAEAELLDRAGIWEGYCVDLGCGNGQRALRLAKATKLHIDAIDSDPGNVKAARDLLRAHGLYGTRVTVLLGDPARTPYPDSFADLVISSRSIAEGDGIVDKKEASRLQKPYGGVACLGKLGSMKRTVRGSIEGAGEWTHQYCDPANTGCSTDTVVKGPLGMLWFNDLDLGTPDRHGRGPSPLFMNGRLFVAGVNSIRAVDPYNGRILWEHPVPSFTESYDQEHLMGAAGTSSSYCAANESVYVGYGPKCTRIDAVTGEKLAEFDAPKRPDGKPGRWGYISCTGELLYGTLVNQEYRVPFRFKPADMSLQFTESVLLFAMDAKTGDVKWTFKPKQSIRNNTIAVGGGRVYLVDRVLAWEPPRGSKERKPHPTGELIALDAGTGSVVWRADEDVWGTVLELSVKHDALLMCYQPTRFELKSEIGGQFRVYRALDGKVLWTHKADYQPARPLICDRTIYAQPAAWDLLTGEPKTWTDPETGQKQPWRFSRSYGCGIVTGSENLLVFRSATVGYVDLLGEICTVDKRGEIQAENYGGVRPGCWINALPVGGLVLMPDYTNKCKCSYLNKASVALQPMPAGWPPAMKRAGASADPASGK